jgi:ribokinase
MTKQPRVVVIGSCNVDLTTFTDRLPRPGETIFGDRFDLGWGGKGANQAVAAHRCGARVDMVARVGDDLFGPAAIANFEAQGVGASHVRVVGGVSSGVAPIFVESNGQNRIVVVKGANDRLLPQDVDQAEDLLRQADCLILQFEIPLLTVYYAIGVAKRLGVRCILNPAPGQAVDMSQVAGVDYFAPNESEAETITGMPVRNVDQAKACALRLLGQGLQRVIITLGARGALFATNSRLELFPAVPVQTLDTTGAGDAFIGSFAVFLAEGLDEGEALSRANLYAALSTTGTGTQKSFVDRARFDQEWATRRTGAR